MDFPGLPFSEIRDVEEPARDLHSLLSAWFDQSDIEFDEQRWPQIWEIAKATKTFGLLAVGLKKAHACPARLAEVAEAQKAILSHNLRNLEWTIKSVAALRSEGIDALVFKGVLRSRDIYGAWDCRPSSDIDILVDPSCYDNARAALRKHGFQPQVPQQSVWWHQCLGEAPFRHEGKGSPFVDLHHRLQQPGGPFPRQVADFFSRSVIISYAGTPISIPHSYHALLITAINYGKALRAHEPTLSHLHEIAYAIRNYNDKDIMGLIDNARVHELENILEQALSKARILFPPAAESLPDRQLQEQVLYESLCLIPRPLFARTRLLWSWTDGTISSRVIKFLGGLMRLAHSGTWFLIDRKFGRLP